MRKIYLLGASLFMMAGASFGQYCVAGVGPSSTADTNLEAANLNGETTNIAYTGCPAVLNVEDQTVQDADLIAGNAYSVDITWGTCSGTYYGMAATVWIDFNGNQVFDLGETIGTDSYGFGGGPLATTYNFNVPAAALNGTHRMRVMQIEGGGLPLDPCASFTYGSVTDFSITISGGVDCAPPNTLVVDSQVADSVFFSWNFGGLESEWEFDFGTSGFTAGTGTPTIAGATNDTITGLAPDMFYELYVRGICGPGDTSSWVGPISFHTFTQGSVVEFDNDCGPGFIDISGTGTPTLVGDDGEVGVALDFPFLYQGIQINDVTIGDNGGIELGTQSGNVYQDNMGFLNNHLMPFGDDMDTEDGDVYYETVGTAPNRMFIVQWDNRAHFSGVVGQSVTFQIVIEEATQEIYFLYDDVVFGGTQAGFDYGQSANVGIAGPQDIDVADNTNYLETESCIHFYYPSCPKPSGLVSTYVGIDTIIFDFVAGGAETEWQVEYGPTGFTPGSGTTFETMTTTDTISGLIQLTTYDIYVTAICGVGDSSAMVGPITEMTEPICASPSAVTVDFVSADSAGISWTNNGTATTWNLQYGLSGFSIGSGTVQTSMTNPDTITGLVPGFVYDVYVQADCGAPDTSLWIGPVQIFTPITNDTVCGAIMLPVDGSTSVYHNTGATSAGEPGTSPNNTIWFTFVAPTSGAVSIANCGTPFDSELEVFEADSCDGVMTSLGYADGNPFAVCDGPSPAGIELCGLNAGETYYFWVGPYFSGNFGEVPVTVTEIVFPEAGTAVAIEVCADETALDMFTGTTGNVSTDGTWYNPVATAGNELPNVFNVVGIPAGTYPIFYVDVDACLSDTVESTLTIVDLPNVGVGSTIDAGCNHNSVALTDGLSGTVDFGGTWYDESSNDLGTALLTFDGEPAGSYDYYYVVDNGVCAADTATVTVDVIDCASIGENSLGLNVYPNPVKDVLTINLLNVSGQATVELFNLQGSLVTAPIAINSTSVNVNMADFADGVYILKVTSNGATEEVRVVKQ